MKGGAAWERDNFDVFNNVTLATLAASGDRSRTGWTVGIGGEYAFADYLSGFVEYNYYDFGSRDITFSNGGILNINETKSVVRAGLNFRFGGWGNHSGCGEILIARSHLPDTPSSGQQSPGTARPGLFVYTRRSPAPAGAAVGASRPKRG